MVQDPYTHGLRVGQDILDNFAQGIAMEMTSVPNAEHKAVNAENASRMEQHITTWRPHTCTAISYMRQPPLRGVPVIARSDAFRSPKLEDCQNGMPTVFNHL